MPRYKLDIVAERPETLDNRANQRRVVSLRKVRTANGSLEQDVPHDGQPCLAVEENDVPWGVARAVSDRPSRLTNRHFITVVEPAIGCECTRRRETKHGSLLRKLIDPKALLAVRALNGNGKLLGQVSDCAGVVDVRVRDQDFLNDHLVVTSSGEDSLRIAARVNQRAAAAGGTPNDRAVLLKRRDGDDSKLHSSGSLRWSASEMGRLIGPLKVRSVHEMLKSCAFLRAHEHLAGQNALYSFACRNRRPHSFRFGL